MSTNPRPSQHSREFEMDLYGVLQVAIGAEKEVIKAAHRALSMKYAPRTSKDDQEKTRDINTARDILLDDVTREAYDFHRQKKLEQTFGNYELVKPLAEGGHCDIYIAKHILTKKEVIFKHCRGDNLAFQQILIEEAATLSELRHFAIPKYREIFKLPDGSLAMIEDYIKGPTLKQFVLGCGPLEAEKACAVISRDLQILRYIHMNGAVHCDIQPSNQILWPDERQAFLVDFGLALYRPTSKATYKGEVDIYSAPEQKRGEPIVRVPANDFYSLGVTLIFMLTGDERLTELHKVPKSTPESVRKFIGWLTEEDPVNRPNWQKDGNLEEQFLQVRMESFKRVHSGLEPFDPNWRKKLNWID